MNLRMLNTRFRPKVRIDSPVEFPNLDEPIDLAVLASLIAEHQLLSGDRRQARDKASKRLKDAVKTGQLSGKNGRITLREFLAWKPSTRGWSNNPSAKFKELPTIITATGKDLSAMGVPRALTIPLPSTIEDCHREIRDAFSRIIALESELANSKQNL